MNKIHKAAELIEKAVDLLKEEVPEEEESDLNTMIEILQDFIVDLYSIPNGKVDK